MSPETLIQIQNIIEKFGFPVFVALCGLLLFAAVFRYMTRALAKKDADFIDYVVKATPRSTRSSTNTTRLSGKTPKRSTRCGMHWKCGWNSSTSKRSCCTS